MKRLVLFTMLFFATCFVRAADIPVTPVTFVDVYNNAVDGDVLLLDAGEYTESVAYPTGKAITLKASATAATQPVINFLLTEPLGPGGSLTFDGLLIDRKGAEYFYNSAAPYDMNAWRFEKCTIQNIAKSLINSTTQAGNITSFTINNSYITASGTSKTAFIFISQTVNTFILSNSTVYNFIGGDFFKPKNDKSTTQNISVSLINNTMYKSIWDKGYGWVSVDNAYPAGNTYNIINNIFDTGANTDPIANQPLVVYKGNGTIMERNNIKVNYANNNGTTDAMNLSLGLGVLESYTSIPYTDASSGNLTIASSTPFATAGVDGAPVGNPSLIVNVTPVTGLSVKVIKINQGVQLNWSTLTEKGTSHFVVERLQEPNNFNHLGRVEAYGDSQSKQTYSLIDYHPKSGLNIYRVNAIDFDGKIESSVLVPLDFGTETQNVNIFPNPVSGALHVSTGAELATVNIYNLAGKRVLSSIIKGGSDIFNVSELPRGIYLIEVDNGTNKLSSRFIKE